MTVGTGYAISNYLTTKAGQQRNDTDRQTTHVVTTATHPTLQAPQRHRLRREQEPMIGYIYESQAEALGLRCISKRAFRITKTATGTSITLLPNTYCLAGAQP